MTTEVAIHSFVDEHGHEVTQPVLVHVPVREDLVCDIPLLEQLSDAGGSVAIIRDGHLGDLLMLTPTLRAIKKNLPGIRLHVLCSASFLRVFYGNTCINGYEQMSATAKRKYTYSVDLRGYVERVEAAGTVDRTTLFGQAFGVEIDDGKPDFVVTDDDEDGAVERLGRFGIGDERYIVIAPDASDRRRSLTTSFINDISVLFLDVGFSTYVTGIERGDLPSLGELGAIVKSSAAVVSGDNGVYHLAAAFGVPSFPIFSTIDPKLRCCWYPDCSPIVAPVSCAPCNEKPIRGCVGDCMSSLGAELVVETISRTVNE